MKKKMENPSSEESDSSRFEKAMNSEFDDGLRAPAVIEPETYESRSTIDNEPKEPKEDKGEKQERLWQEEIDSEREVPDTFKCKLVLQFEEVNADKAKHSMTILASEIQKERVYEMFCKHTSRKKVKQFIEHVCEKQRDE